MTREARSGPNAWVRENARRLAEASDWIDRGELLPGALLDELRIEARAAREAAHAPYSGLMLGMALLDGDGVIHRGCNVESASYGLTICAERNAVFAARATGATEFRVGLLCSSTPDPIPPCGACRQVLFEHAPGLLLRSEGADGERAASYVVADLLPGAMGAHDLPRP